MNIEDYISSGILEQYVLGELSDAEEEEVYQNAQLYPEIQNEISEIEESIERIAQSLAIEAPPHVLDEIQHQLTDHKKEDKRSVKARKVTNWQYGVAATFTLKLVAMAIAAHFWINWQNTESSLEALQNRYDQLEQKTYQLSQAFAITSDPGFVPLILESSDNSSDARPIVYWNKVSHKVYVNPAQLPAHSDEQQYQLWGINQDHTESLGVFDVKSRDFQQFIPYDAQLDISAFLISLERKGGASQPSASSQKYWAEVAKD